MLTPDAMITLAAELTDAQAQGDPDSPAVIAWQLYGDQIPQLEVSSDPTWAPDGSRILFVHYEIVADEFHADLWTIRPDGSDCSVLARTPEIEDQPDWESVHP